jgi:hypothetical protein
VVGIIVVPIAGVAQASLWTMRVSDFRRVADAAKHVRDINDSHTSTSAADYSGFGKLLYGVFLACFVEMLLSLSIVVLDHYFPHELAIDLQLSLLFLWPLVAVAHTGFQRWVWLDFPVFDCRVWCHFVAFDVLLGLYAYLTAILGSEQLWGMVASLLVSGAGVAETGVAETGGAETGVAETGVAETSVAEPGVAETNRDCCC